MMVFLDIESKPSLAFPKFGQAACSSTTVNGIILAAENPPLSCE